MKRVLLLATVLLLSGCGIPATGVIQSGDPATGVPPASPMLYFVNDGRLFPISQEVTEPVDVRTAVELLLAGPDARERFLGLTTELHHIPSPAVTVNGTKVTIQLAAGTQPLAPLATRQLICTAAAASLTDNRDAADADVTVVIIRPDGQRLQGTSRTCAILRPAPSATATPAHQPN